MRIAFFDTKPYDRGAFEAISGEYPFKIDYFESRLTPATAKLAVDHDVVCAFVNDDLGAETVGILASLGVRLLALRCAGFNNVDLAAACGRMQVVRVPKYSPYAVAEFALSLLLCLNRKLHRAYNRVREGNFALSGLQGMDIHGKCVGVVGTGKIGEIFARLMNGFGVRLLLSDPYPNGKLAEELHAEYVPLERLYRESDIISLHCPLTPENTHMIDARAIDAMKDGVILINTSRGRLVDTPALIEGLKSGHVRAAGLDVYEEEAGYFFEDRSDRVISDDVLARLMAIPTVLLTSHQAFLTTEALENIARTTLDNVLEFSEGRPLTNGICSGCVRKDCPSSGK